MTSKEALEFITKLIDSTEVQIIYLKNKIVEDEQYPALQDMHKEELITSQEYLTHLYQIKQDLDRLEKLEKAIEILKNILIVEGYIREDGSHRYYLCKRNVFPVYTITLTKEQYESLKEVLGNE